MRDQALGGRTFYSGFRIHMNACHLTICQCLVWYSLWICTVVPLEQPLHLATTLPVISYHPFYMTSDHRKLSCNDRMSSQMSFCFETALCRLHPPWWPHHRSWKNTYTREWGSLWFSVIAFPWFGAISWPQALIITTNSSRNHYQHIRSQM